MTKFGKIKCFNYSNTMLKAISEVMERYSDENENIALKFAKNESGKKVIVIFDLDVYYGLEDSDTIRYANHMYEKIKEAVYKRFFELSFEESTKDGISAAILLETRDIEFINEVMKAQKGLIMLGAFPAKEESTFVVTVSKAKLKEHVERERGKYPEVSLTVVVPSSIFTYCAAVKAISETKLGIKISYSCECLKFTSGTDTDEFDKLFEATGASYASLVEAPKSIYNMGVRKKYVELYHKDSKDSDKIIAFMIKKSIAEERKEGVIVVGVPKEDMKMALASRKYAAKILEIPENRLYIKEYIPKEAEETSEE